MLKFDRRAFKSGTQVVREPCVTVTKVWKKRQLFNEDGAPKIDLEGKEVFEDYQEDVEVPGVKSYFFKVADKGKDFEFIDEEYVLAKYSVMFTKV